MTTTSKRYIVQPAQKALAVLTLVAENASGMPLSAVCKELKLPKTSAFRYLQTLVEAGFVDHDTQTNTYSIGSKFRSLAKADSSLHRLRMIARPHLQQLVTEYGETVNLALQQDGVVIYIDIVEGTHMLRVQGRVGDRHPLHSTALGKAMLSYLPEATRKTELSRSLAVRTSRTVVAPDALERLLRQAHRLGYATEVEENDDDVACIGAAIVDETETPIAAISLSAPKSRLPRLLVPKVGTRLAEVAAAISRELSA
ncbi:MAG TPA: IclR family transcriptional regulator [Devosia sp.]|nr:IclR family transcriptional regulator [Devosia sp.]